MKPRHLSPLLLLLASPFVQADPPTVTPYCALNNTQFQNWLVLASNTAFNFDNVHADIRLRAGVVYQLGENFNGASFEGLSITGNYGDDNCATIDEQATTQLELSGTRTLHYSRDFSLSGVFVTANGPGLTLRPTASGTTRIVKNQILTGLFFVPEQTNMTVDVEMIGNVVAIPNNFAVETCAVALQAGFGSNALASVTATVLNNTITGFSGDYAAAGICVDRLASASVVNNIIVDSGKASLLDNDASDPTFVIVGGNLIEKPMELVPGFSNTLTASQVGVDPQFLAGDHGPFELGPLSPAINAGANGFESQLGQTDLAGNPRVVGTPDIGAYESAEDNTSSVITVTSMADSGANTLRAAIDAANADDGTLQTIRFVQGIQQENCGAGNAILLKTPLPDITDSLIIDGYSAEYATPNDAEAGFNANLCVVLAGIGNGTVISNALAVVAGQVTIRGIDFRAFSGPAIALWGGANHVIQGNAFGTGFFGVDRGLWVDSDVTGVRIGGSARADRNHIGGATVDAIAMTGSNASIIGNLIGPGRSGGADSTLSNNTGIWLWGNNNLVSQNTISGNDDVAIRVDGNDNKIRYNLIGYNDAEICSGIPCTTSQPNALGMYIAGDNNRLTANKIGNSTGNGIEITVNATNNALTGNVLEANGGLGIDLGANGVPSDPQTMDMMEPAIAANGGQNFPVLVSASGAPKAAGPGVMATGSVSGSLSTRPGDYVVEVFANADCDASGYGEGEEVIGSVILTVPSNGAQDGTKAFSILVSSPDELIGRHVSATARAANGNTSEFSACIQFIALNTAPDFTDLTLAIDRATPATTRIATLAATDDGLPQPAELTYSLLTALVPFTVDADGSLRVTQDNIFDQSSIYNLDIKVDDGEKSTTGIVTILPADLFHNGFE